LHSYDRQVTNHRVCQRVELVAVLHVSPSHSRIVYCDLVPKICKGRSKSGIRHIEPLPSIKNHGTSNMYTGPHPNLEKVDTTPNRPVLRGASACFAELAIQESQHSGSPAVKPRRVPVSQARKVHPRRVVPCRLANVSVLIRSIIVIAEY
jgi:hypothetical protein